MFESTRYEWQPGQGKVRSAMAKDATVIAIYENHHAAEDAVQELQRAGFDMKKLSIVGKDYHTEEQVVGYYNTGDRVKSWGKLGAFWGGIWGLLVGTAFFFVPGVGPVLVAGPVIAWIVSALEGAVVVGGFSAIGAALYSVGIPKDSVLQLDTALKAGKFLVVAHGAASEVAKAREILSARGASNLVMHSGETAKTTAN
jgi:hypothetical protein